MKRYTCRVDLEFELDANTAGEAIDGVNLMLKFIESTIAIARRFRRVTWYIPPTEPHRLQPEVSDG